ncbi:MAG: GNAT family protein [Azospirillaceae bacterium]
MRSLTARDADTTIAAWFGDAEVMHALQIPAAQRSVDGVRRYFQRFDNVFRLGIGIFPDIARPPIGMYDIQTDPRNLTAQLNVAIGDRAWWGRHVVVETRAALLDFLFDSAGLEKVWGGPPARNFPSLFNYKAQRFRQEGVLRGQFKGVEGGRVDQIIFGMLKEEWQALRAGARGQAHAS